MYCNGIHHATRGRDFRRNTIAMLVSAPFDDWWHNAYGLDVQIVSPPHMVLLWGMVAIQTGAILMAVAVQNRASAAEARPYALVYAASGGLIVTMAATAISPSRLRPSAAPALSAGRRFWLIFHLP